MKIDAMREEDRLRNPMTVRWSDADFRLVSDEAWRRRVSASELVRRLVAEGLRAGEKEAAQ